MSSLSLLSVRCGALKEQLRLVGLDRFAALWDLPRDFVEPVNYRRGGWSAVSTLCLPDGAGGEARFYLKRQENQRRHSLRYPEGVPTYRYEADALLLAERQKWPCVDLMLSGFRQAPTGQQAIVLTRAIEFPALISYKDADINWSAALPGLRAAGEALYAMHCQRWQHGALYPGHLFVELHSGACRLIDFERARRRLSVAAAARADLTQLLKRTEWLPDFALNALLDSHIRHLPVVIRSLRGRFPERFRQHVANAVEGHIHEV